MRLGVVVYLAAAVAVVYFSHAVLVHGAHDAQKTFGPEKQGIVDKAKSTAQEAVHQVKDKAGHLFGKEQKLKDPEREELTDDEELLHQKDQSIMDKIKGVLHSGRETVHHGAETARRAKDVKDTVQHRATEAVVDKAKDLLTGKHTHDDHKETFGEKVKDFLHMSGTDKPSVPTKEAKEPVKELAKDYVEAKAKESARESVIDKVKDFLHLKPTPAAEGQTVGEKLKHAAEGVIAGKAVDAVVDKAKEKVREFTKDTEYAGKDDKDDSSIMDRVKDRLHIGKDSDDHATLADKANMYKEATVDAAEAGYEAFKERVDEGPTVKHEPLVQPSIIDRVKDFLHIGRSKTEQAADKVSDKAQQAADKVGDKARQAGDKVRQTADDVKAQAERASSNIRNKAADVRDDVIDAARDARDMIVDKAREASDAARDAKETLVDKARDAKDAIVDKARDAKDVIVEKARDAKDAIVDKAREGKEFVEDAVEYTQDKAKEAVEWGEEKVLDPARAKLEDKQLFDTGHEKTDSIPEEAGKYVKKQARKFGEHVLENDALNTDTDQTPTETDSSDRGILGRAKDTIQAAIKRCFARSKHSGEVIEIECDNSTSTGGFAGIYDDDRANVKFAAKQGAKNTADAAKDGAQDTVDAAREGLRKTANAAKEGLKNTAQRFVEA